MARVCFVSIPAVQSSVDGSLLSPTPLSKSDSQLSASSGRLLLLIAAILRSNLLVLPPKTKPPLLPGFQELEVDRARAFVEASTMHATLRAYKSDWSVDKHRILTP